MTRYRAFWNHTEGTKCHKLDGAIGRSSFFAAQQFSTVFANDVRDWKSSSFRMFLSPNEKKMMDVIVDATFTWGGVMAY